MNLDRTGDLREPLQASASNRAVSRSLVQRLMQPARRLASLTRSYWYGPGFVSGTFMLAISWTFLTASTEIATRILLLACGLELLLVAYHRDPFFGWHAKGASGATRSKHWQRHRHRPVKMMFPSSEDAPIRASYAAQYSWLRPLCLGLLSLALLLWLVGLFAQLTGASSWTLVLASTLLVLLGTGELFLLLFLLLFVPFFLLAVPISVLAMGGMLAWFWIEDRSDPLIDAYWDSPLGVRRIRKEHAQAAAAAAAEAEAARHLPFRPLPDILADAARARAAEGDLEAAAAFEELAAQARAGDAPAPHAP